MVKISSVSSPPSVNVDLDILSADSLNSPSIGERSSTVSPHTPSTSDSLRSGESPYTINQDRFNQLMDSLTQQGKEGAQKAKVGEVTLARNIFWTKLATLPWGLTSGLVKCTTGLGMQNKVEDPLNGTCYTEVDYLACASLFAFGALEVLSTLGDTACAGYDWYLKSHDKKGLPASEKSLANLILKFSNVAKPNAKVISKFVTGPIPYFLMTELVGAGVRLPSGFLFGVVKNINVFGKVVCAALKATIKPEVKALGAKAEKFMSYAERLRALIHNDPDAPVDISNLYKNLMTEIGGSLEESKKLGISTAKYELYTQTLGMVTQLISSLGKASSSENRTNQVMIDLIIQLPVLADFLAAALSYSAGRKGEQFPLGLESDALALFLLPYKGEVQSTDEMKQAVCRAKTISIFLRSFIPFVLPQTRRDVAQFDESWALTNRYLGQGPKVTSFFSRGPIAEYSLKPGAMKKAIYEVLCEIEKQISEAAKPAETGMAAVV